MSAVLELFSRVMAREPLFAATAVALLGLTIPTAAARWFDQRAVDGINVWVKPLKFEFSLAVFLAMLVVFAVWLPRGTLQQSWYRIYAATIVAAVALEMVWLLAASALGFRSHFNEAQPLLKIIYPLMGLVAIYLTSAALVYGLLILRNGDGAVDPVLRHAAGWGLILTFVLTVVTAGALAGAPQAALGGSPHGPGLPIVGWRRDGGDLRAAHFFATHAALFVVPFGWLAARLLPASLALPAVWVFCAGFTGFVAYIFVEALRGYGFLASIIPGPRL